MTSLVLPNFSLKICSKDMTLGVYAYKLLKNLCDPDSPNTKTFPALSQLLQGHYESAPIVIAERHKF